MTEEIARRGRPKGARTAVVELDMMSFKIPPELKAWLLAYAKRRKRTASEAIRELIERGRSEEDETAYGGDIVTRAMLEESMESLYGKVADTLNSLCVTVLGTLDSLNGRAAAVLANHTRLEEIVMGGALSTSEQSSAGIVPEFDPAKYALGSLCEKGHDADGQGHSLRQLGGKRECRECKNMRSRAYKERQRQVQPVIE